MGFDNCEMKRTKFCCALLVGHTRVTTTTTIRSGWLELTVAYQYQHYIHQKRIQEMDWSLKIKINHWVHDNWYHMAQKSQRWLENVGIYHAIPSEFQEKTILFLGLKTESDEYQQLRSVLKDAGALILDAISCTPGEGTSARTQVPTEETEGEEEKKQTIYLSWLKKTRIHGGGTIKNLMNSHIKEFFVLGESVIFVNISWNNMRQAETCFMKQSQVKCESINSRVRHFPSFFPIANHLRNQNNE